MHLSGYFLIIYFAYFSFIELVLIIINTLLRVQNVLCYSLWQTFQFYNVNTIFMIYNRVSVVFCCCFLQSFICLSTYLNQHKYCTERFEPIKNTYTDNSFINFYAIKTLSIPLISRYCHLRKRNPRLQSFPIGSSSYQACC